MYISIHVYIYIYYICTYIYVYTTSSAKLRSALIPFLCTEVYLDDLASTEQEMNDTHLI